MTTDLFDIDLQKVEITQTLFNRCSLAELKAILDAVERGTTKAWVADKQTQKVSNEQNINV
jgi:hypothetical protein